MSGSCVRRYLDHSQLDSEPGSLSAREWGPESLLDRAMGEEHPGVALEFRSRLGTGKLAAAIMGLSVGLLL